MQHRPRLFAHTFATVRRQKDSGDKARHASARHAKRCKRDVGIPPHDKTEESQYNTEKKLEQLAEVADEDYIGAFTFRVWSLGLLFGTATYATTSVSSFRTNPFTVSTLVTVLMAYPFGVFMARVLPSDFFNQGLFKYKEHVLIYVITNVMVTQVYALYTFSVKNTSSTNRTSTLVGLSLVADLKLGHYIKMGNGY
ncbi:hypothetical protein BC830DRAFT_1169426 [Chytriomyces sp. MP71]|nr:hypothetical protein BC830DRAFT_1169426 [Chytriomyces sp. MP71]